MNIKATINRKPWILAVLVSLLVAAWMLSGLFSNHEVEGATSRVNSGDTTEGPVRVQVETLNAEPVLRTVSVYGRTAPARTIELNTETEGRVAFINVKRGERAKKGQVLLTLDLRDREARVKQAQAALVEKETSYKAQSSLKSDGYVSDTQIAEILAQVETARVELLRAKLDRDNRFIRAPFDGVLQEREVEIGDFVRSGDPVATFVDNLTLIVTGTIAEQDVANIKVGDKSIAKLVTGQNVEGAIRYISSVADQSTRTFNVELELDNSAGTIPAGVTAEMSLISGEVMAHKISPALLTLSSDGTLGIMVVDSLQRAEFVPVSIEKSGSKGVWVSGLGEVAEIIIVGQGYVQDGQSVESVRPNQETALAAGTL